MNKLILACSLIVLLGACKKIVQSPAINPEALTKLDDSQFSKKPKTITVLVKNYCPAEGRNYSDLFASNHSVTILDGKLEADSDNDGVSDIQEKISNERLGIDPLSADSNSDGFSDLTMFLTGISRFEQDRLHCDDRAANDGMAIFYKDPSKPSGAPAALLGQSNCEKSMLHLDSTNFDSDHDGIPDYLELRAGLNPLDPSDALADMDNDGINNITEAKRHTPVAVSNLNHSLQIFEYKYKIEVDNSVTPACTRFTISNIPILNEGHGNVVALYLTEQDAAKGPLVHTAFIALPDNSVDQTFELDFMGSFSQP